MVKRLETYLVKDDGSIDIEQLKKELCDFSDMMHRVSCLLCRCTGGKLSKLNYSIDTMETAIDEYYQDLYEPEVKK